MSEIKTQTSLWSEHQHQVQVIKYRDFTVSNKLPGHDALRWLHSVPNGGARHPAVASKLKAEGVIKGISDLMLDWEMAEVHGLRIELKKESKSAKPTPEQLEYLAHARSNGFNAYVCHGYREAWQVICDYLQIENKFF